MVLVSHFHPLSVAGGGLVQYRRQGFGSVHHGVSSYIIHNPKLQYFSESWSFFQGYEPHNFSKFLAPQVHHPYKYFSSLQAAVLLVADPLDYSDL